MSGRTVAEAASDAVLELRQQEDAIGSGPAERPARDRLFGGALEDVGSVRALDRRRSRRRRPRTRPPRCPVACAMRARGGGTGRRPRVRSGTPGARVTSRIAERPFSGGSGGGGTVSDLDGGRLHAAMPAEWPSWAYWPALEPARPRPGARRDGGRGAAAGLLDGGGGAVAVRRRGRDAAGPPAGGRRERRFGCGAGAGGLGTAAGGFVSVAARYGGGGAVDAAVGGGSAAGAAGVDAAAAGAAGVGGALAGGAPAVPGVARPSATTRFVAVRRAGTPPWSPRPCRTERTARGRGR